MSFRFWLCNLIFCDYLRNYLSIDRATLMKIAEHAEDHNGNIPDVYISKLKRIAKDMEWIITGKE